MKKLTVLSFGGGQDSTYILYRIIRDLAYRSEWVKGGFIVVMSDTGAEHPRTYSHVAFIRNLCKEHGIPFYFITPDMGFHPNTWPTLTSQFRKNRSIMSKMYPRACTDNLKIRPFYKFLEHYIRQHYYPQLNGKFPPKYFIKRFATENGKIRVILGIASGEEKRIKPSVRELKELQLDLFSEAKPKRKLPVWMERSVERIYPMVTEGADRWMAQQYILSTPWPLPMPSNCMFCPYMDRIEILWLYRNHPERFAEWVELEKDKVDRCRSQGVPDVKNLGVNGTKMLDEILREAIAEFGHLSDADLEEHKMSHGHCVMSKY